MDKASWVSKNEKFSSRRIIVKKRRVRVLNEIGYRIRAIRIRKGIKQRHIQEKLSKYGTWLSGVETGNVKLYAEDIIPLANVLEVNPLELLSSREAIADLQQLSKQGLQVNSENVAAVLSKYLNEKFSNGMTCIVVMSKGKE